MNTLEIKQILFKNCVERVDNRFQKIHQTIVDIDESLLEESKSSAGDKHETGRAMLQIDRENASKQLQEVELLKALLKKIDLIQTADYGRLGSLIKTNNAHYFIGISIGNVVVNNKSYICVALNSPMGKMLKGKKKNDSFIFNNITQKVLKVE